MTVLRIAALISLLALTASAQQSSSQEGIVPASCPVTVAPPKPFTPPPPFKVEESTNSFLIGNEKLWIVLRKSGVWYWAPHPRGHENEVQPLTEKTLLFGLNRLSRLGNKSEIRLGHSHYRER